MSAAPAFDRAWLGEVLKYSEMLLSKERKEELGRNQVRLQAAMGAMPDDRIVLNYLGRSPLSFFDFRFDCTELWKGQTFNGELYQRFWAPGGEFSKFDPRVELPKIKCPVLIASGIFDFGCPPTVWYRFKDKLETHEYRVFERSGHYPRSKSDSYLIEP